MRRRTFSQLLLGMATFGALPAVAEVPKQKVIKAPSSSGELTEEQIRHLAFVHRIIFWHPDDSPHDGIVLRSTQPKDLIRIVNRIPELNAPDKYWQNSITSSLLHRALKREWDHALDESWLSRHIVETGKDSMSVYSPRIVSISSEGYQFGLGRYCASVGILAPPNRDDFYLMVRQNERRIQNGADVNWSFDPKRFQVFLSSLMDIAIDELGPGALFTEDTYSGPEDQRPWYRADLLREQLRHYDQYSHLTNGPSWT